MVKFSEEQKNIIRQERGYILVSAAAGSGKTTVLSARITSKIINRDLSVDELLVVTFTKDAASHMREKIESSLRSAMKEPGADRKYIRSQIDKISGSYIQTMDSFCNRVVKESGHMTTAEGLPEPGSSVLDDTTLKMLKSQAAIDSVMAVYERIADGDISNKEREDFLNLIYSTGGGKSEAEVEDAMINAYDKLRSLPNYRGIIEGIVKVRNRTDEENRLIGMNRYIEALDAILKKVPASCFNAECLLDNTVIKDENKERFRGIFGRLKGHAEHYIEYYEKASCEDDRADALANFFKDMGKDMSLTDIPAFYVRKKDINKDFMRASGPAAAILKMNRDSLKRRGIIEGRAPTGLNSAAAPFLPDEDIASFGNDPKDELMRKQLRRSSCIRAFAALLLDMDAKYLALKKAIRGIDFPDQEHMCLKILESQEAREFYRNKFKEIYIDEYQDNTSLQDSVVDMISDNNVFCVGDVKQSIYKFRNANPDLFIRKADLYASDNSRGKLMELNCNYRSSPQVISFVNEIFEQLMSGGAAKIDYSKGHALTPSPLASDGPIPEVILINSKKTNIVTAPRESGEDDSSSEDSENGKEIKQMELLVSKVREKVAQYVSKGYKYKDIFVLTRTNNAARAAAKALEEASVPARCLDKKPLFADNEILGLCNLIKLLSNEYRDECLTGVMLSPYRFSNFMLDELAEIISFDPSLKNMNLIVKVRSYASNGTDEDIKLKCGMLIDAIDDIRSESVIRDVGELIELIFARTGIRATLEAYSPYEIDKINVFKSWLCDNFLKRGSDLSELAAVIEQMQSRLADSASIEYDLGGDDLVRCMSYHKSKGLENKCVIVADVDGSNKKDTDAFISFRSGKVMDPEDKDGPSFVADDYDEEKSVVSTSIEKAIARIDDGYETNAEDMRLLYVALTRAEENLCFIRAVDLSSDKLSTSIAEPLMNEGRKLSNKFYDKCHGISNMMLAALLRMKLPDGSSDLKSACGIEGEFPYKSLFDGVQVYVVTPEISEDQEEKTASLDEDVKIKTVGFYESRISGCTGFDDKGCPVFIAYRYEDAMNAPAKTSVSAMKREEDVYYSENSSELKTAVNLHVPDLDAYVGKDGALSGTELGTAVHKVMRFMDFVSLYKNPDKDVKAQINLLSDEGILSDKEKEAALGFADSIAAFVSSEQGRSFIKADIEGRAEREKELMCSIRINPGRDDYKLVQGTLDAMYVDEDGRAVIIDYKTDNIRSDDTNEIIRTIKKRHAEQLELYAAAVEASGIPVKSKYIYLLRKKLWIAV